MTPFQAIFGRPSPPVIHYEADLKYLNSLKELLHQHDQLLLKLKEQLFEDQQYMKMQANKKRREFQFQVGDLVLVKLQPYRQNFIALRKHEKLGMRYFCPFPVVEKVGIVAYKVELPPSVKMHAVFHVALLKPFHGTNSRPYLPFPLNSDELGPMLSPVKVLDQHIVKRLETMMPQLLIQWENMEAKDATWEDLQEIRESYPYFNLEDKVVFDGEGNVIGVRSEENVTSNAVREKVHAGGIRKSNRRKRENIKLKDYSMGECWR